AGRDELADWLALEQAHGGELWPTFTFAAGAAVAGAGPVDRMPELADRPLWMMSHDADPIVPPAATTSLVEAIRDLLDDVDAVHQTAAVTATGATTLGFNSDLAELLAHDRLHTSFTGEGRDGLGPHHWVSQDWPHAGQDDLVARWLFAQSLAAGPLLVGDMNRDGIIDAVDVAPFVLALTDPAGYHAQHGLDPVLVGDINADGTLDAVDVAPFVQLLVGDNATSTPEPGSLVLLGLATLLLTRRRFARVGVTPAATPGSPASA
ncbi:MAG: PEP-CTERM sorting domain-containing protein, partial [Phycisphaeraceae bacterium]